jgi:hypothetical protein
VNTITDNATPRRSSTVSEYVDPHARRLVDAINNCPQGARTYACCSGHYHKPSQPYVAFYSWNWDFIRLLLSITTGINRASRGYTTVSLRHYLDERQIQGSLRLNPYPWLGRNEYLFRLSVEDAIPSRRIAQLWWRELDEMAAMIEERRTWPSQAFVLFADDLWYTTFGRRLAIIRSPLRRKSRRPRSRRGTETHGG